MPRPTATRPTGVPSYVLAALRIMAALLLMQHGAQKLLGWFPVAGAGAGAGAPPALRGIAGVLELFGGALVAVGLFTRPVAFVLSGEMAVAYFMRHAPRGFFPIQNRGELAALLSFVFLYLAAAGAGTPSLDALLANRFRR